MAKAIISDRIYMDIPPNKQDIFNALTYTIINNDGSKKYAQKEIIRNYRMLTPTVISIPQGRTDLIPPGYEIVDKRVIEFADFPAPIHELREDQRVVYDEVHDTCFINALVGWGKTFTALHLAYKWGMKTLVVTHTAALRDQWVEEVEKLFGFKPDIIGDGKFGISTPVVVGNVQSLVKRIDDIKKEFGTLIMDEAHHTPASTFTGVVNSMHARYRLALSGTMQRKDGKHILFPDYFGPKVFKPPQSNTINPTIKLLKTKIKLPYATTWADKVTKLLGDVEYQDFIAGTAYVMAEKGHKVLVVADRVDFIEVVAKMIGPRAVAITGSTKNRAELIQKVLNGEADTIVASRQIFAEGISVNPLSCLILAAPLVSLPTLEQLIGRVQRLAPGKDSAIVIDIQFSGPTEKVQNSKRLSLYLEKGWKIEAI